MYLNEYIKTPVFKNIYENLSVFFVKIMLDCVYIYILV